VTLLDPTEVTCFIDATAANRGGLYVAGHARVTGDFHIGGDLSAGGSKLGFVNPHPKDEKKAIKFVVLEGPENGIYWRTRVTLPPSGAARIPLPEHVVLAQAEGDEMDVLATPRRLCQMAAYHDVVRNEIVVESDLPGVEVSVMCLGTRRYFEEFESIVDHNWTEDRKKDGSAAQKAYGPLGS
jgi:hypothetical protein